MTAEDSRGGNRPRIKLGDRRVARAGSADRKPVKVKALQELTGAARTQEVSVSQVQPVAQKIREIRGEIRDVTWEIIRDKVIVQGVVHKQIFYVGLDNLVRHQSDDVPFSVFIDVQGAAPGMIAQVHPRIEHIAFELDPTRTQVRQKIIIDVFVKVTEERQINVETGEGPLLDLQQVVNENTRQTMVTRAVTLHTPAEKIANITASLGDIKNEVISGKVIIQGVIHKQIFFVDEEGRERHQAEDIPFDEFVEVPGALPGMTAQVNVRVEHIEFNLIDPTTLEQKVILEIFAKVTENVQLNVVVSEEGPLQKVEEVAGTGDAQVMEERSITLNREAVKVQEITATVQNVRAEVIPGKVIVQGVVHKQIFYVAARQEVEFHQAEDISFSEFIEISGAQPGMNVRVIPVVEFIDFELVDPVTLHQKVVLDLSVIVTRTRQLALSEGTGPRVKIQQVVGESSKQILVEKRVPLVPPPPVRPTAIPALIKLEEAITGERQEIISSTVELPDQAEKIRRINAEVEITGVTPLDGEVIVEGVISKNIEFVVNDMVRHLEEQVDFEILVPLEGATPGMTVEASVDIEHISFSLEQDNRVVRQVIVLQARVSAFDTRQVQVFTEVFGPGIDTVDTVTVIADVVLGEVTDRFDVDSMVDLDPPGTVITEIAAQVTDLAVEVGEGQITVSGVIDKLVTYGTAGGAEVTTQEEVPFSQTITVPAARPDFDAQVSAGVVDLAAELINGGTRLSQSITIEVFAKITVITELPVVTDVTGPAVLEIGKETLLLDVVDDDIPEPVLVEVVTHLVLAGGE